MSVIAGLLTSLVMLAFITYRAVNRSADAAERLADAAERIADWVEGPQNMPSVNAPPPHKELNL